MRPKPDKRSILLFYLLKKINKCHREYSLLQDGDRIALALSGGKDSCTLLDALLQRRGLEKYTLVPIHVLPATDMDCGGGADVGRLRAWLDGLGVEYHIVAAEEATGQPKRPHQHPCFYCAWRRRKALFNMAQTLNCNKLALAHNADDVAQTTLMNLFCQGKMTTMYPRVSFFGGKLVVIRPLAYVPEKEVIRYARECDFPPFPPPCQNADTSKRTLMHQVLQTVEKSHPKAKVYLWRAIQRHGIASDNPPQEN